MWSLSADVVVTVVFLARPVRGMMAWFRPTKERDVVIAMVCLACAMRVASWVRRRRKLPTVWMGPAEALRGMMDQTILEMHAAKHDEARGKGEKCWVIWLAHAPRVIATADPSVVEHILVSKFDVYDKGPVFRSIFRDLLGDGIFNADGAMWKVHRKTASYEFSARSLREFMTVVFERRAKELVAAIAAGTVVDVQAAFATYTLHSIGEIGFGVDLAEAPGFARAFDVANERLANRYVDPIWQLERFFNVGPERTFRRAIREVTRVSDAIIDRRRNAALGDDILSLYLKRDPEASTSKLRDVVVNFVLAGRDTTANLLTWTLFELADRPDVVTRLRADLATERRPFVKAVLTESLRLHPSVHSDFKQANRDDTLPDGTFVAEGERVMYNNYAMARNPDIWGPDCYDFRPDRFIDETGAFVAPKSHVFPAFHAGPRLCLGKDVAYLSAAMALAAVLENFDFDLVDPKATIGYQATLTLWVRNGLRVRFRPRNTSSE